MSLKKIILLLLTGFCTAPVLLAACSQVSSRTGSAGGEVFFLPMIILLIWFGWMLRDEHRKSEERRFKNEDPRRKR